MKKTYYIADSEYSDAIYGDQLPTCLDMAEVERLAREWDMTTDELLAQMHEATADDIDEFGAYDSAATSDPLIDNGPYIEADICTPDYELIQPASVCRHPERSAYVDRGYLVRYEGTVYFVEPPHPSDPGQLLPVLFSDIERDWPVSEVEADDDEMYFADDGSVIDPFAKED